MNNNILILNNINSNEDNKKSNQKNNLVSGGAKGLINNSNIISEFSSDNDIENSNLDKEIPQKETNEITEKELRRFTLEYIKVLGIFEKGMKGKKINITEIMEEYEIPNKVIEEKKAIEPDLIQNSEINDKEEKIDFDNDIQPLPTMNYDMKIIIYLSKPKIIGFDGKLGLFYVTPSPVEKGTGYSIVVKNPENMKIIFKIKILEIITCVRKGEKSLYLQNFGTKVLSKANHELIFKNGEECSLVHQGIFYLMNNKDDDIFY